MENPYFFILIAISTRLLAAAQYFPGKKLPEMKPFSTPCMLFYIFLKQRIKPITIT